MSNAKVGTLDTERHELRTEDRRLRALNSRLNLRALGLDFIGDVDSGFTHTIQLVVYT